MSRLSIAYPPELASYVVEHWPQAIPMGITHDELCEVLSTAFQASLTPEETRPLRFRVLIAPPESLPVDGGPGTGVLRLRFDCPRVLSAEELHRLAPAAPFESVLIGVAPRGEELEIRGLAYSGPTWLAPAWGGRSVVPIWTSAPIVHVTGHGQLAVRSAGKLIGGLERGALVDAAMDVFESRWLRAAFVHQRDEVRAEHAARQAGLASPTMVETSLVGRVSQHMLRRAIQLVRGARHGGMLLLADTSGEPDAAPGDGGRPVDLGGLRLKFHFVEDEPSRRYHTLLARVLDVVAAASDKDVVEWSDFAASDSPGLELLERSVFEWARLVANLAAVDGAVVLDKRFALIGFGAEVSTGLPGPSRVLQARDVEGERCVPREIERVGTRHRAAYRFVDGHPRGLAIVVSQDGGVTFVAKRGDDIVFWEQSVGA